MKELKICSFCGTILTENICEICGNVEQETCDMCGCEIESGVLCEDCYNAELEDFETWQFTKRNLDLTYI